MKLIKEIKAVGILDWLWFCFYIKRDEFHNNLNIEKYYNKDGTVDRNKCLKDRTKAHNIDEIISDVRSKHEYEKRNSA